MPGFHWIVMGLRNRAIQASFSSLHEGLLEFMKKIPWAENLKLFW